MAVPCVSDHLCATLPQSSVGRRMKHRMNVSLVRAQATLRLADAARDTPNEILEVKGRHEIVSLVGTLADEGHLHASLSDKDGHVVGGHVMGNMKVFTTAEVVIGNCDMLSFTREMDEATGFDELVVTEK